MVSLRRRANEILIIRMNHRRVASDFLEAVKNGIRQGYEDFNVIFSTEDRRVFPNACVPMAGIINHFSKSVVFNFVDVPDFVSQTYILNPLNIDDHENILDRAPLNKAWMFRNSEEVTALLNAFIKEISQKVVYEEGVREGLTWCLSEVMDNVLQHSNTSHGFVMGQIHKSTKHIAFCIYDSGRGIYNSLKTTKHAPRNPLDAITLCIKEGVTRDKDIGQGNGMWGLHNIVKSNSGSLTITSNSASYMLKDREIKTYHNLPDISRDIGSTTVDFQIDFDKAISIAESLGGYTPVNLDIEEMENDRGNIVYRLSEKSSGTGTRQSGERIRNEVINIYNEARKVIEIDFAGISVISSSFADELIGKLIAEYGLFGFMQIFRLKNMNDIIQTIVNRSVSQRMAEKFI
jgi:hypothetical protein